VLADTFFTLEDGTQIVYFYGEQAIVSTESSTGDKQSLFDLITPDMALVAAVAVLAVVISGNSDGDDSDSNDAAILAFSKIIPVAALAAILTAMLPVSAIFGVTIKVKTLL
jgi:hypothetical protein